MAQVCAQAHVCATIELRLDPVPQLISASLVHRLRCERNIRLVGWHHLVHVFIVPTHTPSSPFASNILVVVCMDVWVPSVPPSLRPSLPPSVPSSVRPFRPSHPSSIVSASCQLPGQPRRSFDLYCLHVCTGNTSECRHES